MLKCWLSQIEQYSGKKESLPNPLGEMNDILKLWEVAAANMGLPPINA